MNECNTIEQKNVGLELTLPIQMVENLAFARLKSVNGQPNDGLCNQGNELINANFFRQSCNRNKFKENLRISKI